MFMWHSKVANEHTKYVYKISILLTGPFIYDLFWLGIIPSFYRVTLVKTKFKAAYEWKEIQQIKTHGSRSKKDSVKKE